MSIEEHLAAVAQRLDMLTKIHLGNDREYRERMEKMDEEREKDNREFRERMDRLREEQERLVRAQRRNTRDIKKITGLLQQDGENIRALANIAARHQARLDEIQGQ